MHESFAAFIQHGRALAAQKGLDWELVVDGAGKTATGWNLTEIAGGLPPAFYLRDFGPENKVLQLLNAKQAERGLPAQAPSPLSQHWQDLLKAAACDQLLFQRNTPQHVASQVVRPLKVVATCAGDLEPWQLTADVIRQAAALARECQPSGRLADCVLGVTNSIIDANHLAEACPLYTVVSLDRQGYGNKRTSRAAKSKEQLLDDLEQRKRAERLPEKRAFWELIRIIFTEPPQSFADALRFAALKILVLCGLRVGEALLLPADWQRYRDYYDPKGRPAGDLGGYSRALLLRHFAEKQQTAQSESTVLFETTQPVPEMFEEILTETLDEVGRITAPLRETLRLQAQTGRLLPWYQPHELVPVTELYGRLTGNPLWLDLPAKTVDAYLERYRQGFNPEVLHELARYQQTRYQSHERAGLLNSAMYVYLNRLTAQANAPRLRRASGAEYIASRKTWGEIFLRVDELERYLAASVPTKLSDLKPLRLQTGELQTWELLFLSPKRSLAEERNGGITDLNRYFSVGILTNSFLLTALGEDKEYLESLFARYGATDEDCRLILNSHALRHLQNTELFRLGVADTIITKRFNRRSVAQSYAYDHRSLAEELDSIELPAEVEAALGAKAATVARLIQAGKATGPLVAAFKRIQREEGDEAAFDFLKAESDGFHATPYGHCINSFTVDPCPKNLECFAGCCHLTATDMPEHRGHLVTLEGRLQAALDAVQARPAQSVGRSNQIAHATIRLDAVRQLLATPAGQQVFPAGPDLSLPAATRSVLDD